MSNLAVILFAAALLALLWYICFHLCRNSAGRRNAEMREWLRRLEKQ
jgi:hypothetical protein